MSGCETSERTDFYTVAEPVKVEKKSRMLKYEKKIFYNIIFPWPNQWEPVKEYAKRFVILA